MGKMIKDKQQKVEALFIELGAVRIKMPWGYCYSKGSLFYKTDIIPFPKEPYIVIEIAENKQEAKKQIFEDGDVFPLISITEEELLKEVKSALLNNNYGFSKI